MSLANESEQALRPDSNLLIDESPYQFLPMLAQMYGDTCALILQQLHYISRKPFFHNERLLTEWEDGLLFVRIEGFMWWDSIDGFLRHLSKSTFERRKGDLETSTVLIIKDRMIRHHRPGDKAKWYAINHEVLRRNETEFRKCFEDAKTQREAERAELEVKTRGTGHWRPLPGEDTSRHLTSWTECLSEHEDAPSETKKAKSQSDSLQKSTEKLPKAAQPKSHFDSFSKSQSDAAQSVKVTPSENVNLTPSYIKNREVEKNKEKQQQQAPKKVSQFETPVVVVSSSSSLSENSELIAALVQNGVTATIAEKLIIEPGAERCRAQLDYFPFRRDKDGQALGGGGLRRAIEEAWAPPQEFLARQKAAEDAQKARAAQESAAAAKAAQNAREAEETARAADEAAYLDAMWAELDDKARERIDALAMTKLGFLGNLGRGEAAKAAFRRDELRKLLGLLDAEPDAQDEPRAEMGGGG